VKASASAGRLGDRRQGSGLVFTPVQVVAIDDAWVNVTGLAGGSRVVSVGAQKLDAGIAVRAVERTPEAGSAAVARSGS
jgi:hypothetical protein